MSGYILTTFAHGNGPFSRTTEWAIAVNDVRQERGMKRLPIVMPLVYPGRQERITKEEIETNVSPEFLKKNPGEILFDKKYGEYLGDIMFKSTDYEENLRLLLEKYAATERKIKNHLEGGARTVQTIDGEELEIDLRDVEFQLGLNNRVQTGVKNQFYTNGGAGPFDEILERAIADKQVKLDKEIMKQVLPIARRMIENQKLLTLNIPGVFSYDENYQKKEMTFFTPPFVHFPKEDATDLPGKGIYLIATGIDGVRESGMYDAVAGLGMQIYAPEFSIKSLPAGIKEKAIALAPSKINNPNVVAVYARGGWSSVWLAHLAEKAFITPKHPEKDDPEILFNQRGIERLNLGSVIDDNPKASLEKALKLAEGNNSFNYKILQTYKTLDGIRYAAELVVDYMNFQKRLNAKAI